MAMPGALHVGCVLHLMAEVRIVMSGHIDCCTIGRCAETQNCATKFFVVEGQNILNIIYSIFVLFCNHQVE